MADVTKATDLSVDGSNPALPMIAGNLYAGAALAAGDFCYIKGADGLVYPSDGTAANEKARIAGMTPLAVSSGAPVTLLGIGWRIRYAASGLTPGAAYFLSTTPGALGTAASLGDAVGIVAAISATDVRITRAV